jgi:succinate dehydrogenase / fumarate reductase flavoprotein subunit
MSTIPGCFVIGEANFSDHGANRLGASALMQGLQTDILYFLIRLQIIFLQISEQDKFLPILQNLMKLKKKLKIKLNSS